MSFDEPPDIADNVEIEWTRCEDCDVDIVCRDDEPSLCMDCRTLRDQWATVTELITAQEAGGVMSEYYDRAGNPIEMMDWATRRRIDKRVAETTLPNGRWVSTVWLGLDHGFGHGAPLIFETMVFPSKDDMGELDCERYSTEDEARLGHARLVEKWADGPVEA